MGIFDKVFSSSTSKFKKLDPAHQRRVATLAWLSGYAPFAVRGKFADMIESAATANDTILGSIPQEIKNKIVIELTLAIISSCQIPDDGAIQYWWGLGNELLRELIGTLILAESKDNRIVLQDVGYSSNPDESRAQVLLQVSHLLGIEDGSLIRNLSHGEFIKSWYEFVTSFVGGTLIGVGRSDERDVIDNTPNHLRALSTRGEAIIADFIDRATNWQ